MHPEGPPRIPPVLEPRAKPKDSAPTLYALAGLKLLTGVILLLAGLAIYAGRNLDFDGEIQRVLQTYQLDASTTLPGGSADPLGEVSPSMLLMIGAGSSLYGLFSVVQGVGLFFRTGWAGWLAIGETAIFVPLELWDLMRHFSVVILLFLAVNIAILWYLYANRERLFGLR